MSVTKLALPCYTDGQMDSCMASVDMNTSGMVRTKCVCVERWNVCVRLELSFPESQMIGFLCETKIVFTRKTYKTKTLTVFILHSRINVR